MWLCFIRRLCVCIGARTLFEEYSTTDILLGQVNCSGSEETFFDCKFTIYGSNSVSILDDGCQDHAGVICEGIFTFAAKEINSSYNIEIFISQVFIQSVSKH